MQVFQNTVKLPPPSEVCSWGLLKMLIAKHHCRPESNSGGGGGGGIQNLKYTPLEDFQGCCCCAGLLLYMWERYDRWIPPWSVIGRAVSMVSLNFSWLVNSRSRHPLNSQLLKFQLLKSSMLLLKTLFSVLIADYLQFSFITKYRNVTKIRKHWYKAASIF